MLHNTELFPCVNLPRWGLKPYEIKDGDIKATCKFTSLGFETSV